MISKTKSVHLNKALKLNSTTIASEFFRPKYSCKEGWATKRGNLVKTWKRRWMVLHEDFLYWFDSDRPNGILKGAIPLAKPKRGVDEKNEKVIVLDTSDRQFVMKPLGDFSGWMDILQNPLSLEKQQQRIKEGKKREEEEAKTESLESAIFPNAQQIAVAQQDKSVDLLYQRNGILHAKRFVIAEGMDLREFKKRAKAEFGIFPYLDVDLQYFDVDFGEFVDLDYVEDVQSRTRVLLTLREIF